MAGRRMHAEFAERLRLALDEAGFSDWSHKRLAGQFDVTPQALRKWLAGEAMPTATHAQMVAARLGVRRAWLLDNEAPMRAFRAELAEAPPGYAAQQDVLSLSGDEFRLVRRFRGLPQGVQRALLILVDSMGDEPCER